MSGALAANALNHLFREARSFSAWLDTEVSQAEIEAIYELAKMGPTSANQSPARFVWCHSADAKARLSACAAEGNKAKILAAPVTVIIGHDLDFHDQLPWLFPHTDARRWFTGDEAKRAESAFRNGTLQGAYVMLAARALGLDCGPMSGFDNKAVDAEFFADQPRWCSNFIASIGHGDRTSLHPRGPRPEFDTFNRVV